MRHILPSLLLALISASAAQAQAFLKPPPTAPDPDEKIVRQAGYAADPAGLLRLLTDFSRTEMPVDAVTLQRLIVQLGHEEFAERERATRALVALGRPVLPRLRRLADHPDAEIARRAVLASAEIEARYDPAILRAAARLLIRRRVPGAAAPLLAYLPDAGPDGMEEVVAGLVSLGRPDGRLDPALVAALTDPRPDRRAAASLALGCQATHAEERSRLAPALTDRDPNVRLRAAQGLLAAQDDAAVPVLIDLLAADLELAWQAEELLCWLAGPHAHLPTLGKGSALVRTVCRACWIEWWRAAGKKIDWARVAADPRRPGLMLICENKRVWMSGCDGRERWSLSVPGHLVDAHLLPGPRLLVADVDGSRVAEIDLSGKLLWEYRFHASEIVLSCQRLPGGNTFIVADDYLIEVAPDRATVWTYRPPGNDSLCDAYRAGTRVVAVEGRHLVELTVGVDFRRLPTRLACNEGRVLPWGSDYLVVDINQGRVLHLDADVKIIDSVPVRRITSLEMLPGGTLLAVCGGRSGRIVEMTPTGRVLQETLSVQGPVRVRSCLRLVRIGLDQPRAEAVNLDTIAYRIKCMKDPEVQVRRWSAEALGGFGEEQGRQAIGPLVDALADPDLEVRQNSAASLTNIGAEAIGPLRDALRTRPEQVRIEAARVLAQFGDSAAPAIPELRAALLDARAAEELRCAGAIALGSIGGAAAPAIPDLLTTLNGTSVPPTVRREAASALGQIGRATPAVVSALIAALDDKQVRLSAARALGCFGPNAAAAVPSLMKLLRVPANKAADDDEDNLRGVVAETLGVLGPAALPAVPLLAAVVKDTHESIDIRLVSMIALAGLGEHDRPALLKALSEVLLQQDLAAPLSQRAADILSSRGEAGVQALIAAAKAGNRSTRRTVIMVLGNLGVASQPALPVLREAEKEKDIGISNPASRSIRLIEEAIREKQGP